MSQLGLEPRRDGQEEEGKWVTFGETACLPWQVKLAWPPRDLLSKGGMADARTLHGTGGRN